MLKRIFIKLPLYVLWLAATISIIIPLIYWIITGDLEGWTDITEDIDMI